MIKIQTVYMTSGLESDYRIKMNEKKFCCGIPNLQSISSCNNFKGEIWKEIRQRKHILRLLVMLEFPDFFLVYQVSARKLPCHQDSLMSYYICCAVLFCSGIDYKG